MQAIVITSETEPIQRVDLTKPDCKRGESLVKISHASLNRRDQWVREGMYPNIEFGTVLGSDGCGVVVEGSEEWLNKEVIINPNVNWGSNPAAQSDEYTVLGMPENGTLAEYVVVSEDRLIEKPTHLSSEEAAAIPLAGLTAYRAVFTKGQLARGQKVLVTGIGGGVAQFASQFSMALGAEVFVTSGSDEKIQRVCTQGATSGFNLFKV